MIPQYLNKTLPEKERLEFELSLDKYPELKREFQEFSEIKSAYNAIQEDIPSPSDAVFNRVMNNVSSAKRASTVSGGLGFIEQIRRFFEPIFASPRVSWAVVGVQMAAILILVISVPRQSHYTTLTSEQGSQLSGIRINIIFDPGTREMEIRSILNQFEGRIINGPSSKGLYTILVKEDRDIKQTIEDLKKDKAVKFAEKGYGNGLNNEQESEH